MRIFKLFLLALATLIISSDISFGKVKAFAGATLINPETGDSIPNSIVLVDGSKIIDVGQKIKGKIPENTEIIQLEGKYIIPGLIDGHIHFFQSGGLYARPDGLDLRHRVPYEDEELKWVKNNIDDVFRRYIRCGITTVIDMGGPFWNFDIREQSKKTKMAPRVYCAGPLLASYQPPQLTTDDPPIIRVDTKKEAIDLIHKQHKAGTDYIKVWYVVSRGDASGLNDFYPIYKEIVKESHKLGYKVFVHATELETARKAVEGGADVLVHQIIDKKVDSDFLERAKENDIINIPTLWVFNSYAAVYSKQLDLMKVEHLLGNPKIIGSLYDMYELSYDELEERQRKLQVEMEPIKPIPPSLYNLKKMEDYGITVAAGTDAGNVGVIHGASLFHEFDYMKQAGLTSWQILKDATINGAKLLDLDDKIGSIEKGKLADMVVLNSNPVEDIQNVTDISLIIKDGNVFEPDEVLKYSPEDLAQIQLNAYNERDLEAFLSVYSDDVKVYQFPDKLLYTGKEKMRKNYRGYFEKSPNLHCKLVNRIVEGKYVVDKERVTGARGDNELKATALYEVADGKIQKVWFMK